MFRAIVVTLAIFVGALLGIVPMNYAMRRFGTHKTMIVSGVTSVITTALTPVAVTWDFRFLLVVRVLQVRIAVKPRENTSVAVQCSEDDTFQGTSMSNPFPAIGAIITNWASVKESGLFVSILTGYIQISAVFSMPVSGVVSTSCMFCACSPCTRVLNDYFSGLANSFLLARNNRSRSSRSVGIPFSVCKRFRSMKLPTHCLATTLHCTHLWAIASSGKSQSEKDSIWVDRTKYVQLHRTLNPAVLWR